jgi:hypothetical protein
VIDRTYPDLSTLWRDTIWHMWRGTLDNGLIDIVGSADTISYDNVLRCDSMAFDLDMGRDLWLNKQRWTRLVRDYVEKDELLRFVGKATELGQGSGAKGACTTMFARNVERYSKRHRWGNCMLAFTYRGCVRREQPTLVLHSRVSYIAYIGGLDLALAHVLARTIGKRLGVPPEEFAFRWHVDALQFHGFKSLPMLYKTQYIDDLENERLRRKYPTINLVGKWYDKIKEFHDAGITDNKYGPLKRVMRRYREYQAEDYLPTVTVRDLTWKPLYP